MNKKIVLISLFLFFVVLVNGAGITKTPIVLPIGTVLLQTEIDSMDTNSILFEPKSNCVVGAITISCDYNFTSIKKTFNAKKATTEYVVFEKPNQITYFTKGFVLCTQKNTILYCINKVINYFSFKAKNNYAAERTLLSSYQTKIDYEKELKKAILDLNDM